MGAEPAEDEELVAAQARIGQTLGGKWRLDELLGVGGMAAVYAATHKNNLKNVAVKVLHAELQRNEAVRTRFLREGYVANKVGHPGAVAAIDDGIDEDGAVYLVMELLHGQSLAQRVDAQGGKLAVREVLTIADGILDVLAAAHAENVVHRDLKPDNVFIVGDGGVKVLDFGVARVLENTGEAKTRTGVVMGTPEYMPPEQARGRTEHIDGRTDLWAVGAMMFRLITGRYVHVAETQNEVLLLAMTAHAKKLADVLPTVHPKVAELVDRALAYEPLDRFPDAASMRAAVKDALAALDAQDTKATMPGQAIVDDDDVDDAAATLPVSDILKSAPSLPDDSGQKAAAVAAGGTPSRNGLWVHTKATPPEPPKPPQKKRRLLPIAAASTVLAALSVGLVYELPRIRGGATTPEPSATTSTSAATTTASATIDNDPDAQADDDAGDEVEMEDDVDASPAATTPSSHVGAPVHSAPHVVHHTKPHHKKHKR